MLGMPTFDFTSERGKQEFQKWITFSIKNEINSYARQVLSIDNTGVSGGGGAPSGPAGGVLSGNYPDPSFAVDMATQAELDNHASDTTSVHGIADTSLLLTTADLTGVVYQNTPYLDFDTVAPGTDGEGVLLWSIEDGGLVFGGEGGLQIPIGQKNVIYVKNGTGSTIAKGKAVMAIGAAGDRIDVALAVADGSVNAQYMLGVAAESIPDDSFGFIVTEGYIRNVNTNAWPVGTVLYFDPDTPGALTTVEPNAPDLDLPIAIVTKQNSSSGILYIRMKVGEYFNELHDVAISAPADLDIIQYNAISGLWENNVLAAGGSITVSDSAPVGSSEGDLWYNSSNGKTYIYYDSFWVEVGNTGAVDITADTIIPAGMIMPTAGSVEPSGWLYCYGQNLSRSTYARLFTAVGTTYGVGDGSTTFGLPDLRGRTIAGKDDMGGSTASRLTAAGSGITGTTLGANGGTQTHTLTEAQMPSHTHIQNSHNHGGATGSAAPTLQLSDGRDLIYTNAAAGTGTFGTTPGTSNLRAAPHTHTITANTPTNQNTGGGTTHQNTQPTIILNYLIKT